MCYYFFYNKYFEHLDPKSDLVLDLGLALGTGVTNQADKVC